MQYISTRGQAPPLDFEHVTLAGLAPDGGLFVPDAWPALPGGAVRALAGKPYAAAAAEVLGPFTAPSLARAELDRLLSDSYAAFEHKAVTPLVQIDEGLWLLELFHGPTLAFKDVALQFLGRLFDHILSRRGERVTVIGATSGDTGSAAIEACRDRESIDIFILHPEGRTSEVQRRQMTTVDSANVHNIAIDGTFDDCQNLVKAMFGDAHFREDLALTAVNSINWARIVAQSVYYAVAAAALGAPERPAAFAVPTGNFGNIYAAYAARALGVPIDKLIVGTNKNDILHRFFTTGAMTTKGVEPTLSPSMDIQISSNFERLLFDMLDRDAGQLAGIMAGFKQHGHFALSEAQRAKVAGLFASERADDAQTLESIARVYQDTGMLIDPHTAVGVHAARQHMPVDPATPAIALACAHPAKFPDAVERATGIRPALPPRLADLFDLPERVSRLPNELARVQSFIRSRSRAVKEQHA